LSTKLDNYNQMISALEDLQNQAAAAQATLRETNKRMLAAAEAHHSPTASSTNKLAARAPERTQTPDKKSAGKTRELSCSLGQYSVQ
jgi:predicted  nucleic acid-binding Zn-ribbon protein